MSHSKGTREERRTGERKGMRYRDDYIILWGDLDSEWRLYRMDDAVMDGWSSLIEHACRKDGEIFSGHWVKGCNECSICNLELPEDLITLWQLHNADQMWRLKDI